MGNKVQLFVLALALLLGQLNCQSISLGDVFVKWNRFVNSTGDFTRFVLTSTLPKVTDVRDAWIAIGLNNQYQIDGADIVVCKMSKSDSGICHLYANQVGFEEATGKSLGLSNTKVIVSNDTKRLTCSFTRDNSVNPKSVDYSHTLISVAYGKDASFYINFTKATSKFISIKLARPTYVDLWNHVSLLPLSSQKSSREDLPTGAVIGIVFASVIGFVVFFLCIAGCISCCGFTFMGAIFAAR